MFAATRITRNITLNYAGALATALAFLVVTPILVGAVGPVGYGLWILAQSIVVYLQFLDFGLYDALVKFVSERSSGEDRTVVNATAGITLVWFIGAGVVSLAACFVIAHVVLPRVLELPAQHLHTLQVVIVLLGIDLLVSFPAAVFDGLLEGFHRFDILNYVTVGFAAVRTVAMVLLLSGGHGIVSLALLEIALSTAGLLVAWRLVRRCLPDVGFTLSSPDSPSLGAALRRFSLWISANDLLAEGGARIDHVLIPVLLSVTLLTPYSLVCSVAGAILLFVEPVTEVFFPLSSALDGAADRQRLRVLLESGSRLVVSVGLPVAILLFFFGEEMILVWIGEPLEFPLYLMQIVVLGRFVSVFVSTACTVLVGVGKLRQLFVLSLVEATIAIALVVTLVPRAGLVGVALAFTAANIAVSFVGVVPLICRTVGSRSAVLLGNGLARPLLAASPAALAAGLIAYLLNPREALPLIAAAAVVLVLYAPSFVYFVLSPSERRAVLARGRHLLT